MHKYIVFEMRALVAILALVGCPGCAVLVQNRYSVLGFDGWEAATPAQARAMSLGLLAVVSLTSAALGAVVTWWLQRRVYQKRIESWLSAESHSPAGEAIVAKAEVASAA